MLEEMFYELVEQGGPVFEEGGGDRFLQQLCSQHNLTNAAYLGVNLPLRKEQYTYIIATYSNDWIRRYQSQNYVAIDPVIQAGLRGILPIDWGALRSPNRKIMSFFGEAAEFGVAKQGLTFPIRGTRGETAMFSINCEMSDREWAKQKRSFLEKFWIIACSFHQSVLERECHVAKPKISLTPREMEILKWAAAGKSEEETSIILGITKRTVEFMMSNVRGKLGASNKVEAAVKAVRLNLI